MSKEYSEEIQRLLKSVIDECDKEDRAARQRQIRTWRRLKLLWEGFQRVWYDEVAHDWRVWDQEISEDNTDQAYYDKQINVFRAYLESIIAALSAVIPKVICYPDDADNNLDILTARAGNNIGKQVYRHNNAPLLWLHALFIYCTEAMVACYNRVDCDEKYGTYEEEEHKDIYENHEITSCSKCGAMLNDEIKSESEVLENEEKDEFDPASDDAELHSDMQEGKELCPQCMALMDPEIKNESFRVTRLVGKTTKPKGRVCLGVFGGLNVKVPNYARTQAECGYLIYEYECDYALAVEEYEHLQGRKKELIKEIHPGSIEYYEQWGRLSPQYQNEYPAVVVTVKNVWLRPAKFNVLGNKEDIKKLKKLFPDGAKVKLISGEYAEACNENLDDHWTLTHNPMSDYLQFNPAGLSLTSIQDITNDIISLTLQTIEHGISMTFVDPRFLNTKQFAQLEAVPGAVIPTLPQSRPIGEGFYEVKTASLSAEVLPFSKNIQSLGQLASGALPSLFGGAIEGSETASQYSMSRAQARQRLQNTWRMLTAWWKEIFGKVIPMQMKEIRDDERDVERTKDGSFVNVFIRRAELEGKIGKVELEANENLPMDWNQVRDLVMQLMQSPNPQVMEILSSPENIPVIQEVLGLSDLVIPNEDDKDKQYDEIKQLLESQPMPSGDGSNELPSVEIDPIFDNHQVHFDICKRWATSEAGRQAKNDNPAGYKNVLLHGTAHFDIIHELAAATQREMAPKDTKGAGNPKKPDTTKTKEAPIMESGDVQTIQ